MAENGKEEGFTVICGGGRRWKMAEGEMKKEIFSFLFRAYREMRG